MAFPQDQVTWLLNNRAKAMQYARALRIVTGLFLLTGAYFMGRTNVWLLVRGVKADGRIVDYQQRSIRTRTDTSIGGKAYMPVVEYRLGSKVVRFEDWLGSSIAGDVNKPVAVLCDTANPTTAMIDRGVWNWLPWGPLAAVGMLLLLSGIKNLLFPKRSASPWNQS